VRESQRSCDSSSVSLRDICSAAETREQDEGRAYPRAVAGKSGVNGANKSAGDPGISYSGRMTEYIIPDNEIKDVRNPGI